MTINAIDALNKLAIACDPCNETMELVRTIRAALSAPAQVSTPLSRACETALLTFPPKEELNDWFDKYGHVVEDALRASITPALSSPAVPVIEGLDEAIKKYDSGYLCNTGGKYNDLAWKAARAYAALQKINNDHVAQLDSASVTSQGQEHRTSNSVAEGSSPSVVANLKMQKVDLDKCKWEGSFSFVDMRMYNAAIDDIKAKYGELYAEAGNRFLSEAAEVK